MKKFAFILFSLCFIAQGFALRTGIYAIEGSNSEYSLFVDYEGTVSIEKDGDNYIVTWWIGHDQVQVGVGILNGDVLSVAYKDLKHSDMGVCSFRCVTSYDLRGNWASISSRRCGYESLIWLSY